MGVKRDRSAIGRGLTRMPETGAVAGLAEIREIARRIADQSHPQRIILFGSCSAGAATERSDVDLLVVMETPEAPLHMAARIAARKGIGS